MKIVNKLYNCLTKTNMATKVYSIKKILDDLNKGKASNPWVAIDGLYSLNEVKVDAETKRSDPIGTAMILKSFINKETGEIQSFLAKWLEDEPQTIDLA